MNKLHTSKQIGVLTGLIDGMSMQTISRIENVSVNTVGSLLVSVGRACALFHSNLKFGALTKEIYYKEFWSYNLNAHDIWTWTATQASNKLVYAWGVIGESGTAKPVQQGNRILICQDLPNKLKNHLYMLSVYFVYHNFCVIDNQLLATPAMQLGLAETVHDLEWVVSLTKERVP